MFLPHSWPQRAPALGAVACLAVAAWLGACSGKTDATLPPSGPDAGAGAQAGQGGGGATTGAGGSGGGFISTGGSCSYSCSADLKKVIGCGGEVVEQCGGEQACLSGACSDDPCGAAEASKSSYGCDYWTIKPDLIPDGKGACFAAYVANTWSVPVHLEVERQGKAFADLSFVRIPEGQGQGLKYAKYDAQQGLPVGKVAVIFLSHELKGAQLPTCPDSVAAVDGETGVLGTGYGHAFHIKTDRPVVAYTILPFGGGPSQATSATLLLPTSAWDTNYVAVNAYAKSQIVADARPSLDLLAFEDGTEVTMLPKADIAPGDGIDGAPAGKAVTYKLDAGQYLQISQNAELTGSPVQSSRPIGMWGGASCMNVPVSETACDSAHQQIPPVKALGSQYVGVRYRNRTNAQGEETPPWRVVGAVNDTKLTWIPATPPGAPTGLDLGKVYEFASAGPFVVKSQDASHPFYIAQYMTGGQKFNHEGDPEWVNIVPVDQYLDKYVFFTDPTYPETNLVVVRRRSKSKGTFADVFLDCIDGPVGGFAPVGDYEYARVDLVTGDFTNVGKCSNGQHVMKSDLPFAVTVWGWGSKASKSMFTEWVSYAYPAGASVQPINEVVVTVPK
ncbi:MAG: IgGFc-binding protein [Deltaproteobacteria bacterium]|nr:IgGFc-binding protein [Deltaproteobacteria bacterium]